MRTDFMKFRVAPLAGLGMAVAVMALLSVTSGAARTESEGLLYACYVPNSGTVYRIKVSDTKQECASRRHVEFHWNETGPAGAPGLKGEKGDAGPQGVPGVAGASGITGYEVVSADFGPMMDREFRGTVSCPAGKRALGGGVTAQSTNPVANFPPTLSSSAMTADGTGWSGKGFMASSFAWLLHVSATCANATP
jgi:hypothetical protein